MVEISMRWLIYYRRGRKKKKISKPSAKYRRIVGKCFNHKRKRKKKNLGYLS
jgi:16S rRNA A1518/A1519 N6-dimethyltransferase RsmA/KsgA/DIM1 with predicted DNA glycosylase/AP lyase activity